jgi:uncharacterized protein involved in type VI secretion and phage assembly
VAQAILDEINANFIEAEGVAFGNPAVLAGKYVKIGKVGTRFGGKYKVTTARHIYSPSGYDTYFTIEGMRPRQIADLVGDPGRSLWGGVYPAIVTNNSDDENKSRVKVKFPWLADDKESHWVRVVGVGAGATRGIHWLPEVNDEVLVAFERGDFNRPYILGGLWNGVDAAPETAAAKNGKVEIRTIQTRVGHKIRLVDDATDPIIEIVDSKGNTTIKMEEKTMKITITSKGDIDLKATGNLNLEGMNVSVKAKGSLTAEAATTGSLKANGTLEIKGTMVNIN